MLLKKVDRSGLLIGLFLQVERQSAFTSFIFEKLHAR